ncbi:stage V sporulation protein AD [Alkalihalobacillus xiaoxiensis]|uniref:Stage V sporulation protein AD n=1 Tax=Shouchella xiaoxiensis TaxID=766895 RepID=A0ABS2SUS4_9BACI|nr:stage V sporulation protein AD [Shouchella xiaoxiensis]MBM7838224.1 stage V sporulation protein AD [Shouchella xiaoxiensis]
MGLMHRVLHFSEPVYVESSGTAVGPKEGRGPLGRSFDYHYDDLRCGEKSWELAEQALMRMAVKQCLEKKHITADAIDLFIAGDLNNQTTVSSYVATELKLPFLGSYSACATSIETLLLGSVWINGGFADRVLCAASSHYGVCEKQFRYPTEFAFQKQENAQTTVTGAGALVLSKRKSPIQVTGATIGRVVDFGLSNPHQLGAAMAPAAAETTMAFLNKTDQSVNDFDLIVTGDLGKSGSEIFRKLLREQDVLLSKGYEDCGVMIYGNDQKAFAGGSGAGCSASVIFGHIMNEMLAGSLKKVMVIATGALLSSITVQQKKTIPAIAHAIVLERRKL